MKKLLLSLLAMASTYCVAVADNWSYEVTKGAYTSHDFSKVTADQASPITFNKNAANEQTWNISITSLDAGSAPSLTNNGTIPAGILIGTSKTAASKIVLSNKENYAGKSIEKITVKIAGGAKASKYDANITVGDFTEDFAAAISGTTAQEITCSPNASGEIVITFSNTNTGTLTNGGIKFCSISIDYSDSTTGKREPGLSFDGQASYELILGYNVSSFVAPKLNNPNGVTVTYSSSNEAIAIVDETTGDILLEDAEGTATITATFEGDDTYEAATVSYTIVIKAPEACATPTFSATAIYAGESVTITSTEGSTISYMINGGDVMEGLSPVTITFSEVGTYEIYASASKDGYIDSEDVIETITVSEKPEGDLAITAEAFNMSGTAYAAYTFESNATNVTYAAKAVFSNGIQINTAATTNAKNSGITIIDNPDGLIIAKIIIRTYDTANGKINDIEFSNTPGVLTKSTSSAKDIAVGFPENTVTVSASPEISSENMTFTFTPTGDFKYFLLTSSKAIQITGFDVFYKKPAVVEPVAPAAPVVLVNGNDVEDFESPIDLQQGSVEITLTAEEGHHIYHKHVEAPEEAIFFDGEAEEDIHAGFTHVPTHSATLTVNKNGTLTYYAFNPETQMKSEPVSLSFSNADTTTISEVEIGNGKAEWFDVQGRRVVAPSKGLFIKRQGNQTVKVCL